MIFKDNEIMIKNERLKTFSRFTIKNIQEVNYWTLRIWDMMKHHNLYAAGKKIKERTKRYDNSTEIPHTYSATLAEAYSFRVFYMKRTVKQSSSSKQFLRGLKIY